MTTPEPWEEPKKELWEYQYDEKNEKEGYISKDFIRTLRTAAYEQGKREAEAAKEKEHHECTEDIVRQLDEALNARNNLLTALKSVLGEKNTNVIPSKKRTFIKNYFEDTSEAYNGGWNDCTYEIEGTLNDIFTHFIKEQEEI